MAAIVGFGTRSILFIWWLILRMNSATRSTASGASRSNPDSAVPRSMPTLKYFSYSEPRTTTRTDWSCPSSSKAAASSATRSSATELLPLRCITTRAIAPSRVTSMSSLIASSREKRNAARHLDHCAGDVARLLRAQKGDGVRDVGRLAKTLEDGAGFEPRVHGVGRLGGRAGLGHDDAGRDRVRRDVVAATLERRRLRQPDEPGLRRRVARLSEPADGARHRGHEDEAAPLVLDQVGPHLFRAVERAREVDPHVPVPQLIGLIGDLRRVVQRGGVVDQDVDLAELLLDLLEDVANLLAVGDVHLDGERLASHLADLLGRRIGTNPSLRHRHLRERAALRLGRLLEVRVVLDEDVRDHDVGAEAGQGESVLTAQAA